MGTDSWPQDQAPFGRYIIWPEKTRDQQEIEHLRGQVAAIEAKNARIQELEFVIEYAASSLDLIHPDDSDFSEKLNKIYQNLENKTRYKV
jgi:hypothetical protein